MSDLNTFNYGGAWEKIKVISKSIGREATYPFLVLWYVMKSPLTPLSDKLMIVAALSYLFLPIDFISAIKHPFTGHLDELTAIVAAYNKAKKFVTPEIESQIQQVLEKWFSREYFAIEVE
jgi:uncharacterized membrane protein YkvA (DUF1232 family)